MVCMGVIKKLCVLVIFERDKLYCKSQIQPLCAPAEFCWHLMGKLWYCVQTILLKAHFLRSTSTLEHNPFRFYGFDFLAGFRVQQVSYIKFIK